MNRWLSLLRTRRGILIVSAVAFVTLGCSYHSGDVPADDQIAAGGEALPAETNFDRQRATMVDRHMRRRDISDPLVLAAMEKVRRHEFVPENHRSAAYYDGPLPIGNGQTISQPYIVALMTQLAQIGPDSKVLDVGTGSGYQAAVLAEIVDHVYSIEIVETLADQARERLQRLGYENIEVRAGDGYLGWPQHAPFDAIVVAAAPDHIPQPLVDQLAPGGHLIIPVGKFAQTLVVVEKKADGSIEKKNVAPVAFVPMTGQAQQNH